MSGLTNFLSKGVEQRITGAKNRVAALDAARKEARYQATKLGLSDEEKKNIPTEHEIQVMLDKYHPIVDGVKKQQTQPRKLFLSTGLMSKVAVTVLTWVIDHILLAGALNLFVGDPDIGKTLVAIHYIAKLTKEGRKVVVICREDDYGHAWKPRLWAANADLDLIIPVFHVGDENDPEYKEDSRCLSTMTALMPTRGRRQVSCAVKVSSRSQSQKSWNRCGCLVVLMREHSWPQRLKI